MVLKTFNNGALLAILISIVVVIFSNSFLLLLMSSIIISLSLSYIILKLKFTSRVPPIKGIPCIPNDSFYGYSKYRLGAGKGLSHLVMLEHAEKYATQYGCCQFEFMGNRYVSIFDPCLAKIVLRDIQGKGKLHEALTPQTPKNVFSLDTNEAWSLRRSLFRHPFSPNVLRHFENVVRSIVLEMCNNLDKKAESGEVIELDIVFQKLAIDVISEVAFQYKLEGKFEKAYEKVSKSFELIQDVLLYPNFLLRLPAILLPNSSTIGQYKRITEFFDELADDIFKNICKNQKEGNLKDNSLAKSIYDFSQKPDITLEEVKSEIRLMFIAGFETTAHTLSFFFYSLAANPIIQLKVQESIDNWYMENDDNMQVGIMPPYVEGVLKESFRKYPTAANGSMRVVKNPEGFHLKKNIDSNKLNEDETLTQNDEELEDFLLPKGTWVIVDIYSLHNCSNNWVKPKEFIPERFLTKEKIDGIFTFDDIDEENETKKDPFLSNNPLSSVGAYGGIGNDKNDLVFAPFSYGPRNCLGMHLSMLELRTTIMRMVLRYSFELADKEMLDDSNMMETYLTMRPKNKLPMYLTRRD